MEKGLDVGTLAKRVGIPQEEIVSIEEGSKDKVIQKIKPREVDIVGVDREEYLEANQAFDADEAMTDELASVVEFLLSEGLEKKLQTPGAFDLRWLDQERLIEIYRRALAILKEEKGSYIEAVREATRRLLLAKKMNFIEQDLFDNTFTYKDKYDVLIPQLPMNFEKVRGEFKEVGLADNASGEMVVKEVLARRNKKGTYKVAIAGKSAAGKTTLSQYLLKTLKRDTWIEYAIDGT